MKATSTVQINSATMIEALQMYFDSQLVKHHTVTGVKAISNGGYNSADFEITLAEAEEEFE